MQASPEHYDWAAAWQAAKAASTNSQHGKAFWNHRAASFAAHATHKSDYPEQFLKIIRPQSHWRVLDVGCGPGTIALPMAPRVIHITAMDFSDRMLAILQDSCKARNIGNITPVQTDWKDDWRAFGIEPHDVVIASRSMVTADLPFAIDKMNHFATRQVCISAIVADGPFDRHILAAVGRTFRPGPDYIYILNQLHRMKIYARLDFTVHPINRTYVDHDDALDECRWMIPDMTAEEEDRLLKYFKSILIFKKDRWVIPDAPPVRWAVICWEVPR
jgi:SAM-dependent methyltransferase